jgi:hypothetical protein
MQTKLNRSTTTTINDNDLQMFVHYFNICCMPSLFVVRYAVYDYIEKAKENKLVDINMWNLLDTLHKKCWRRVNDITDYNGIQYKKFLNTFGDTMMDKMEKRVEDLYKAVLGEVKKAKIDNTDFFASIAMIHCLLSIQVIEFRDCCTNLRKQFGVYLNDAFKVFSERDILEWYNSHIFDKVNNKLIPNGSGEIDMNSMTIVHAINKIRERLSDLITIESSMKFAYKYTKEFNNEIPFEESGYYASLHGGKTKSELEKEAV